MAEINIAGETFNVLVEGDETKPALLLVNGLGTSLHMWDAQVPELIKEFRVVRYDGRGHGASAVTGGPYSIEGLARDALAILDALGIGKAHFTGLSMGGFIGQWILCYAPERIGRAVLANTGAQIGSPDLWNSRINKIHESGIPAVAGHVVERWFSKDFREAHPEVIAPVADVLKQTSVEGYVSACAALRDADLREAVRSIKAKVLIIASTYDLATPPELGEYLAQVIDGAKLIKLETGHLSNVEDPVHFTKAVMDFLTAPEIALPASTPSLANASRRPRPVKRTIGTPVPQPTGSAKVAAKKAPSKPALLTTVKPAPAAAPAPKGVVVQLPASKQSPAKKPAAVQAPAPQKAAAKPVANKGPAKTSPVAKAAPPAPITKAAASRSAARVAPAAKTAATNAPVQKAVAAKAPAQKLAAKPALAEPLAAPKPAAKKAASPAPAAKSMPAAKTAPVKNTTLAAGATKAAAPKAAASKAPAPKAAAAKPTPAKSAAAKSPAAKTTVAKAAPAKAPAKNSTPGKSAPSKPAGRPAR